ncbi:MAG: hypothetical protein ACD_83C00186G0001 [uncultured bacterium]|nr:MAG: hypothetical protein ACD_83C00186G0001 [uncultured bacterium]OGJ37174.1 MAG: hypothetical protein A2182_01115 [Candidatus Pacebacteria bacterium RIFOXYA1_FULL_38_18]OGJ38406.1 MAG: hypothetical protein A2383_03070 [Candidatus Pacebacteria bacterium RIFOXYB1_FULL_39_46]OGJ40267.1 MAG: hypothetical protein A2411_03215 [Candidatus Pacebacteria bacterium RIFOXYC1_FULL_39_21]OGJ40840.1 MAG: hypothetical protein A2582_01950 [Candidatus Pacebacteria bacterium RIFOXYD1_FULL_39_27]
MSFTKTTLRLVAVLALLSFGAWSFWRYQQAQKQLRLLNDPQAQSELVAKERQELLAKVGQLMVLPEGEEPLILDIQDAEVMAKAQPFFQNTVDGDKVLIYVEAGKSIIYSPSRNIIVNTGALLVSGGALPLDIENPLQIEIRQGGASDERIEALQAQLLQIAGVEILEITKAANQNYQGPIVVALVEDEARLEQARIFAANLGVPLTEDLPTAEATSEAEVLVIAGK